MITFGMIIDLPTRSFPRSVYSTIIALAYMWHNEPMLHFAPWVLTCSTNSLRDATP